MWWEKNKHLRHLMQARGINLTCKCGKPAKIKGMCYKCRAAFRRDTEPAYKKLVNATRPAKSNILTASRFWKIPVAGNESALELAAMLLSIKRELRSKK
jgi:hypothetical protein